MTKFGAASWPVSAPTTPSNGGWLIGWSTTLGSSNAIAATRQRGGTLVPTESAISSATKETSKGHKGETHKLSRRQDEPNAAGRRAVAASRRYHVGITVRR